jgi:hypothetical protein
MRYVDVHYENSNTFSYEFASILRDCGSVFSSVLDASIKGSAFTDKEKTNIADYKSFLKAQDNTDEIWTNIGVQYKEESYDIDTMKRIFPESE